MRLPARRILLSGILRVALVLLGIIALGLLFDFLAGLHPFGNEGLSAIGITLVALGVSLEAWGTYTLWMLGSGTPNPVDPPRRLVMRGPYRFSRNPLYVARLGMLIGGSLVFGSVGILLLSVVLFIGLHFFLVPREEQRLEARYGNDYLRYKAHVSRWITLQYPLKFPYKSSRQR